jgi:hypothetical protein
MTLIGAVILEDKRILLGGDTHALVSPGPGAAQVTVPTKKVFESPKMPKVLWGYSGGEPTGYAFRDWMMKQTFSSWDDLASKAKAQLAHFNGQATKLANLAESRTFVPTDILVAGFVGGEGRIVYIDDEGGATTSADRVQFIGSGLNGAYVSWETAKRLAPATLFTKSCFRDVMEATIERGPGLGPLELLAAVP